MQSCSDALAGLIAASGEPRWQLPDQAPLGGELTALADWIAPALQSRDRHRLLAALRRGARRPIEPGQWQRWCRQAEKSLALTALRHASLPDWSYPELPVSERADEIAELLQRHQVIIVAGATGSGKTTQLPKICLAAGRGINGQIGHTQPRRIAARSVAERIASELQSTLGEQVGYQVRFNDQSSERSLIKLMTDGILLAEIQRDRFLSCYDTLIIDEAHERSLNIDFLLGYLRQLLPKRPDLKVIITSATIDMAKFSSHFDDAPIVEVEGRTYPVAIEYRDPAEEEGDLDQQIVDTVAELHSRAGGGDILVFLAGEREIREATNALRRRQLRDLEVVPLYARLTSAEQQKIFAPHRGRRVVLSTNVAETSLTVPGIRYVIDSGRARVSRYSYRSKVQRLPIEPISQASANQRAGRCGRVSAGVCVRLYSEDDFNNRPEFTEPEILRTNLAAVILRMLQLEMGDIGAFPFVDPPDSRLIRDGYQLLEELQAVDGRGTLTALGKQLALLPVDPRLAAMLIYASRFGALADTMVVVAALSIQDPRDRPADKRAAADQAHARWRDPESDFAGLVLLWNHFEEQRQALSRNQFARYCRQNFVSYLRVREWRDLHHQIHQACRQLKLTESRQPASYEALHRSILAGLLSQVAKRAEGREYDATRNRKFALFPGSGPHNKPPPWIMAAELLETSRQFAVGVAKIEPQWLSEQAGHLIKSSYSEPFYHRNSGQVMASERQTLFGLTVVESRRVSYGATDPVVAREVFIRQALVEGGYSGGRQRAAPFFAHNRALIEELEALEARTRRRDILCDDEVIYQFYAERLPLDLVNRAGFEAWRKKTEAANPALLFLDREQLLRRDVDADELAEFPDSLTEADICYPLSYHFEPGSSNDGVTVSIAIEQLHQAPRYRFEWLVPGMLKEKCLLLLKALPKQQRKALVPLPLFADKLLARLRPADRPLCEALAEQLKQLTGLEVDWQRWQRDTQIDPWYLMNIELLDSAGEQLVCRRDLASLQSEFSRQVSEQIATADGAQWQRKGVVAWDFGDLPEQVELRAGKRIVKAWPALRAADGRVDLVLCDNPQRAAADHLRGQIALAKQVASKEVKYLTKQLLRGSELALRGAGLPERELLADRLIDAALGEQLFPGSGEERCVRSQRLFDERFKELNQVVASAQTMAQLIENCLAPLHEARQLYSSWPAADRAAQHDILTQLDWLFGKPLARVSEATLRHYPRYARAIAIRAEKRPLQRLRDDQALAEVADYQMPIALIPNRHSWLPITLREQLDELLVVLQEYRVSLFAQQLKTAQPVSAVRLQKRWMVIDDALRRL